MERWSALRCPHCEGPLEGAPQPGHALRCSAGHAFDVARQGYVFLAASPIAHPGDSADMVAARHAFLGAGHFAPLHQLLADVPLTGAAHPLVVDAGAGTGHALARVLDAHPDAAGIALDASRYASRRAARAHRRAVAVLTDTYQRLPLASACADLVLNVFAPRNPPEFHRICKPDGRLVVVTPAPEHLRAALDSLDCVRVAPDKATTLEHQLDALFERVHAQRLTFDLALDPAALSALVRMGPSARHLSADALRAWLRAQRYPFRVGAAFDLGLYRPRRALDRRTAGGQDASAPGSHPDAAL